MSLPQIIQPYFKLTVPSNSKKAEFRPFLVKEEKILLIAQQGGNDIEVLRAIKQILKNCFNDVDIETLTTFDIEYMFLKLRAKSIDNIIKLKYIDNEDGLTYDFAINLDEIEVTFPGNNVSNKIKITDEIGIVMKYPIASISDKMEEFQDEIELMMFFVVNCIEEIYDAETVYLANEYSQKELEAFVDSLNMETFEKIREFFESIPKLEHKLTYKNSLGNDREIILNGIRDFFQ